MWKVRDHAWDYFGFHAKQRTQMFQYFVVVAGLLGGAIGLRGGFVLNSVSFYYATLAQRTRLGIEHIPEPATGFLLGGGPLVFGLRHHVRRHRECVPS